MRNTHTTEQRTDAACETGGGRGSWLSRLRRHATTAKAERAARSERGEIGIGMIIGLGITVGVLTVAGVIIFNVVRDSGDSVESAVGSSQVYFVNADEPNACNLAGGRSLGTFAVTDTQGGATGANDDGGLITVDEEELGVDMNNDGTITTDGSIRVLIVKEGDATTTLTDVTDGTTPNPNILWEGTPVAAAEFVNAITLSGTDSNFDGATTWNVARLVRTSDSNGLPCIAATRIS